MARKGSDRFQPISVGSLLQWWIPTNTDQSLARDGLEEVCHAPSAMCERQRSSVEVKDDSLMEMCYSILSGIRIEQGPSILPAAYTIIKPGPSSNFDRKTKSQPGLIKANRSPNSPFFCRPFEQIRFSIPPFSFQGYPFLHIPSSPPLPSFTAVNIFPLLLLFSTPCRAPRL
ncbi:hypothetical protein Agabi119p4_9347 [Agaricus bisporus var. burnettii]|uniref:Uncharacterized protein n=1 Tax=Agaricus bisporus var. burnettii TaxID=192524 RepID=A0A8H7C3K1_AGABI|nr:hypothetical protein Agabi119p4_9347 [Agaricus bisporus var. burnettii]